MSAESPRPGVNLNALPDDSLRYPLPDNAVLDGAARQMLERMAS
jgi:hypothetical protein